MSEEQVLPYPRVPRTTKHGGTSEEYVIPDEDRASVLDRLYPFDDVPCLDDARIDIHTGQRFVIREFKVVREAGSNYLVSPYYFEGGGTVIDWFPAEEG